MLHRQALGLFERVGLVLLDTIRPDRYFDVFRQREIERQIMVALYSPIAVAAVIDLYVEYFDVVMENFHHVNWYIFPLPHLVQRIVVINGNSSLGI